MRRLIEPSHLDLCFCKRLLLSPVAVKELKQVTLTLMYLTPFSDGTTLRKNFNNMTVVIFKWSSLNVYFVQFHFTELSQKRKSKNKMTVIIKIKSTYF